MDPRQLTASSTNYGVCPAGAEKALAGVCPVVGSYGGKDRSRRAPPQANGWNVP